MPRRRRARYSAVRSVLLRHGEPFRTTPVHRSRRPDPSRQEHALPGHCGNPARAAHQRARAQSVSAAVLRGRAGAAFQAQFAFLIARYEQLGGLDVKRNPNKTYVADYIFEKDKLFACLNLGDAELEVYNRYYELFRQNVPTPDLVIYLQATPEVLKKRLKKKNAPGEKAISDDYLEEVIKAYEHFFFHYTSSDLLIVNTSEIDFVERSEDLQALLRRVSEPIRGTQYFLPLGPDEQSARA